MHPHALQARACMRSLTCSGIFVSPVLLDRSSHAHADAALTSKQTHAADVRAHGRACEAAWGQCMHACRLRALGPLMSSTGVCSMYARARAFYTDISITRPQTRVRTFTHACRLPRTVNSKSCILGPVRRCACMVSVQSGHLYEKLRARTMDPATAACMHATGQTAYISLQLARPRRRARASRRCCAGRCESPSSAGGTACRAGRSARRCTARGRGTT